MTPEKLLQAYCNTKLCAASNLKDLTWCTGCCVPSEATCLKAKSQKLCDLFRKGAVRKVQSSGRKRKRASDEQRERCEGLGASLRSSNLYLICLQWQLNACECLPTASGQKEGWRDGCIGHCPQHLVFSFDFPSLTVLKIKFREENSKTLQSECLSFDVWMRFWLTNCATSSPPVRRRRYKRLFSAEVS